MPQTQTGRVMLGVRAMTEEDAHTVVKIENFTVDFNAKQFDKNLPCPRIISVQEFKKEWKDIV